MNSRSHNPRKPETPVPPAAGWLGAAGVLPFLALATALAAEAMLPPRAATLALTAYGAVILSFLGGIQWGLASAAGAGAATWTRLGCAVLPALVAWGALLLPPAAGFVLLALAFMVVLGADLVLHAQALVPAWYVRLRWPLTTVVTLCLLIAAIV
ncbi:MAG: DUF3429 domain-containing protein [Gammaproteobacteria bacterium]